MARYPQRQPVMAPRSPEVTSEPVMQSAPVERPRRAFETRDRQSRQAFKLSDERGRLHIDTSKIPSDYAVKWVRHSILGKEDQENVRTHLEEGWLHVHADELPGESGALLPGEHAHEFIERGGMVLMGKPKSWVREDEERMHESTRADIGEIKKKGSIAAGELPPGMLPANRPTKIRHEQVSRAQMRSADPDAVQD